MANVLVIGANGYIGRHLCKQLSFEKVKFIAADLQKQSIDKYTNYLQIDIVDCNTFKDHIEENTIIFFFAGRTGTLASFSEPEIFVTLNELGLLNLLNYIHKKNFHCKIIFPSSRLVYKGQKNKHLTENDDKEFKTIYAINKFACEQYLKMYSKNFELLYLIFRICVPYGNLFSGNQSFGTLSGMMNNAINGKDIIIFGDGSQKRSLIHIEDLCRIMVRSAFDKNMENDIFNIAGPDILSISEIAAAIANKFKVGVLYIKWPKEQLIIESGDTIFDETKLQKKKPFDYSYTFSGWIESLNINY